MPVDDALMTCVVLMISMTPGIESESTDQAGIVQEVRKGLVIKLRHCSQEQIMGQPDSLVWSRPVILQNHASEIL